MSKPVAYQWLNTAHFRKKIPKHSNPAEWNALCHISSLDSANASEKACLTDAEIERLEDECIEEHQVNGLAYGQRFNKIKFARLAIATYEAKRNGATK